jgi:hypothetical protein
MQNRGVQIYQYTHLSASFQDDHGGVLIYLDGFRWICMCR